MKDQHPTQQQIKPPSPANVDTVLLDCQNPSTDVVPNSWTPIQSLFLLLFSGTTSWCEGLPQWSPQLVDCEQRTRGRCKNSHCQLRAKVFDSDNRPDIHMWSLDLDQTGRQNLVILVVVISQTHWLVSQVRLARWRESLALLNGQCCHLSRSGSNLQLVCHTTLLPH